MADSNATPVADCELIEQRLPARNTAFPVHFVIRGAEKRRSLAYAKAKMLQRELGVIPRLTCVK